MSVLTRDAILKELASGRLRLEPFSPDQIGPASIDLHLGPELRVPLEVTNGPIDVTDDATPEAFTRLIPFEKPYVLAPGHTVHGITRERLFLPPDLCAWIEGRSRIARLGLTVHVSSGFVQPGVANRQVLEMSNFGPNPLELFPGTPICQFIFQRTIGSARYAGTFRDQDARDW